MRHEVFDTMGAESDFDTSSRQRLLQMPVQQAVARHYPNAWMAPYIRAVGDWVAKKPWGERYSYLNPKVCAMAQYHQAHGQQYGASGNWPDPQGTNVIANLLEHMAASCSTFGAFRERIEEWLVQNEPAYIPLIQP